MSRAAASATVIVPGLAGPPTAGAADESDAAAALTEGLDLSGLARLLRHAQITGAAGLADTPCATLPELAADLLGVRAGPGAEVPAAALSRAALSREEPEPGSVVPPTGAWVRADPVHLRADMAKLVLFPPEALSLSLDQAARIVEWLNAHEHFPGPPLEMLSATCWVCRMGEATRITTVSPAAAYGSNAHDVLPQGDDAGHWNRCMNEIQMLLHQCPVNEERDRDGLAPVNSVWFWGGGTLPEMSGPLACDSVCGDDPVLAGAARLRNLNVATLPADGRRWCAERGAGHHLLALDALELPARGQDLDGWRDALGALDAAWFGPLADALEGGALSQLDLHTGDGLVHVRRATLWQRWRGGPGVAATLARLRRRGAA